MSEDWYWAAYNKGPALDRFVIANGKDALWARVRSEIDKDERCAWNAVHQGEQKVGVEDILELLLVVVPGYRVNHNRFVIEAAQMPSFAKFLKSARHDLPNYVSNSSYPEELIPLEPYSPEMVRRLGMRVSHTLGIEADWFEY